MDSDKVALRSDTDLPHGDGGSSDSGEEDEERDFIVRWVLAGIRMMDRHVQVGWISLRYMWAVGDTRCRVSSVLCKCGFPM